MICDIRVLMLAEVGVEDVQVCLLPIFPFHFAQHCDPNNRCFLVKIPWPCLLKNEKGNSLH